MHVGLMRDAEKIEDYVTRRRGVYADDHTGRGPGYSVEYGVTRHEGCYELVDWSWPSKVSPRRSPDDTFCVTFCVSTHLGSTDMLPHAGHFHTIKSEVTPGTLGRRCSTFLASSSVACRIGFPQFLQGSAISTLLNVFATD